MKKRLILFPLIIIILISLAGCGEKQKELEPVRTKEEKSNKKEEKEPETDDAKSEVAVPDSEELEAEEEEFESDSMTEPVDVSVWAQIYYDYLSKDREDIDYYDFDYSFIYLDSDDIPELYLSGYFSTGSCLFYISQGEVQEEWINEGGEYIDGSGLLHSTYGEMGFSDGLYQLEDGDIKELARGYGILNPEYTGENWWELLDRWWGGNEITREQYEELNEMFTVRWNDEEITFEEYEHRFKELFDTTRAIPCYEEKYGYSFDKVLSLLRSAIMGEDISDSGYSTNNSPFYGIWCASSKDREDAEKAANLLAEQGFDGRVFITTDWSNLNSEKWYVVTAGVYPSKEEADAVLSGIQSLYPDAYIKYSGDWIGTN